MAARKSASGRLLPLSTLAPADRCFGPVVGHSDISQRRRQLPTSVVNDKGRYRQHHTLARGSVQMSLVGTESHASQEVDLDC